MNDEGFKKFIKNRTIEDIMNDYADQRDEWETLVEIKDGYIVRFKHNNGKYFFCMQYEGEDDAVILMPEKTAENKTISEQMESLFIKTEKGVVKLSEYEKISKLILKGDVLIGVLLKNGFRDEVLLFGQTILDENKNNIYLVVDE